MKNEKLNLEELFATINNYFSPKVIAEVNDVYVKIVKVKGPDVPWHTHDGEDELFYVLEGRLTMQIKGEPDFDLNVGEMFVVPKGVEHRVFCVEECRLLLIENKTTAHTGSVKSSITKSVDEQKY
ncbi:MAG: cupin domain-containing protein [Acidobacteria bacterium]|nr:cupin domain-containing protein [Acidobacteriota bacterium]MBU4495389.1 cupin domain-containing protein [Acidobacteriota bacterium]MCG2814428.1 cupin domain-containing protein [Candidatus Aminicenantes bacterium]